MSKVIPIRDWQRRGRATTSTKVLREVETAVEAGQRPLPNQVRVEPIAGWHDPRKRQLMVEVWSAYYDEHDPYLSGRTYREIVGLTEHPSQMIGLILEYGSGGEKVEVLGGHYAFDSRPEHNHVELCFDRSFVPGLGLHRFAIDYRLYALAVAQEVEGRSKELIATYAAIDVQNERSRRNYRDRGAEEINYIPGCLRYDGGSEDIPQTDMIFAMFHPMKVLSAFWRTFQVLQYGGLSMNGFFVPVHVPHTALTSLSHVERMATDIARAQRMRARIAHRLYSDKIMGRYELQ